MNRDLDETYEEMKAPSMHDDDAHLSTVLSSTIRYKETEHARLRRKQRCIDKKDLKDAIKYGTREPCYFGYMWQRVKYTYQGIVYIVDEDKMEEVTCYANPVKLSKVPITSEMKALHEKAVQKIQKDLDSWTSHTVIVVDTSGSMRTSDIWGTRNRLQSVWFSVAIDYIAERLENGGASMTDVVSIVEMGAYPSVVCEEAPTTWILYNDIVNIYGLSSLPRGHGYFLPSLTTAEELLNRNSNAACAAALIFLSDGAPSDQGPMVRESILEKVDSLAKSFGRRLTFTTIGIGDPDDFSMLQRMVNAAKDYGATAEFQLPSMTSSSLGATFTSIATSLTTTQTEITDLGTMKQRQVRKVLRESKSKASESLTEINDGDFWVYAIDEVKRKIYEERIDANGKKEVNYETVSLQHPDARFVAISKGPFGEGAERFAYRFYEVAADRKTIVGRPLVAKESRMVLETEGGLTENDARKRFVRKFIMTQQLARRLAVKFNDKLRARHRVHEDTPQVSFLDCSIYELTDKKTGISSVLVEEKLDHNKWHKWNSNNGMVDGIRKSTESAHGQPALLYHANGLNEIGNRFATFDLDRIEEGSDDEEDDSDDEGEKTNSGEKVRNVTKILFTPAQVAQAFSHFSYKQSDRKILVCDLQGVYDEQKNILQFSDPVIHYYNPQRTDRRGVHGRTDRGRAGMKDFFATHSCQDQGHLCQRVTIGFRRTRHERSQNNLLKAPTSTSKSQI